jgi:hypothetical protein
VRNVTLGRGEGPVVLQLGAAPPDTAAMLVL